MIKGQFGGSLRKGDAEPFVSLAGSTGRLNGSVKQVDITGWLFRTARNRDGQSHALEEQAQRTEPGPARPATDPEARLEVALGTKLLEGWLSNRRQTLVPHTLNFRALSPDEAALLVDVMAAAAQADGEVDAREAKQLPLALERAGAGETEARRLHAALAEPQHLGRLLSQVEAVGLAAHAYAAALLAINRRGRVNRAFLDYVARRLGLSAEAAGSLERRYRT